MSFPSSQPFRVFASTLIALHLNLVMILPVSVIFAGSAAAQGISPRCEAAMDRAAGDYSRCLLRADASYARHESATKLENRQARCETRFGRRTTRAINRHGADECASTDLVAAMGDRTVSYAEGAAMEAGGGVEASFLFVQNADGGTLTESTLTLTGLSADTVLFSDRPYRVASKMSSLVFIAKWGVGVNSFSDDPPNAGFTCEVDGETVNYVVELTSPSFDGVNLSYAVAAVGDTVLPAAELQCDSDSHLFIDSTTTTAPAVVPSAAALAQVKMFNFYNKTGDNLNLIITGSSGSNTSSQTFSFPNYTARSTPFIAGETAAAIGFSLQDLDGDSTYIFVAGDGDAGDCNATDTTPDFGAANELWNFSFLGQEFGYAGILTNHNTSFSCNFKMLTHDEAEIYAHPVWSIIIGALVVALVIEAVVVAGAAASGAFIATAPADVEVGLTYEELMEMEYQGQEGVTSNMKWAALGFSGL